MNKLRYKNPDSLRTNISQLINFIGNSCEAGSVGPTKGGKGEDKLVSSTAKVEEQGLNQLKMPSKYASILTCSFEKDRSIGSKVKMFP